MDLELWPQPNQAFSYLLPKVVCSFLCLLHMSSIPCPSAHITMAYQIITGFTKTCMFNLPSVVTGKEISMQAADCAFRNGGLPGPQRFTFETSALERRFPELQL